MAQGYSELLDDAQRVRNDFSRQTSRFPEMARRRATTLGGMSHRAFFVGLGFASAMVAGCAEGTELPSTSSTGSTSNSSSSGTGGSGGIGEEEMIPEPDGPSKLTIVNGVNDYDAIRLCFVPWPNGGDTPAFPADSKGLAFAAPSVLDLASGVVPEGTDVFLHVIAGNLGKTNGQGCAAITGGALDPDVLVVPLAVIPASAFEAPRSLLLVPHGCLGGPDHDDPKNEQVCGKGYSIDTPTSGLLAAGMSRIVEPDVLSLQAAHAVVAMPKIDIRILSGAQGGPEGNIAPALTLGAVGNIPPFREFAKADLGPIGATNILTVPTGNANPTSTILLQEGLSRGGIPEAEFKNGQSYTLVAVGSPPGVMAGGFWHALTWTVVRADP